MISGAPRKSDLSILATEIKQKFSERVLLRMDVSAHNITTFSLGGTVPLMVEPTNIPVLSELVEFFIANGVAWRVLGAGSNVVVRDEGFSEVVIRLGDEFRGAGFCDSPDTSPLECFGEAGVSKVCPKALERNGQNDSQTFYLLALGLSPLMGLSRRMSNLGLGGLEFAAGIPATLGGAIAMNAGACGSMMSEVVEAVYVVDCSGALKKLSLEDMQFSYRSSCILSNITVVAAMLRLVRAEVSEVQERRMKSLNYRKKTQPLHQPSAGSVFTNPAGPRYAAQMLEESGLKGERVGGVAYSEMHSNWLVKVDESAKASDVIKLVEHGQVTVLKRFGINLEPEIIIW